MSNALEYRMVRRRINVSPGFLYAALKQYKTERGSRTLFLEVVVEIPANMFDGEFDGNFSEGPP